MRTSIMAMYAMSRRQAISRKVLRSLLMAAVWLVLGMASAHAGNTVTTVTYVYTNAQGTPLAKADAQGNIIARYTYRPYGSQQSGPTSKGPGYTGHVNDPDTGLVYMQQRYYDPAVGRFISPDPVAPKPGNIFNFGRYTYANDNPYRYIDPTGRCSKNQTEHIDKDDSAAEKLCARIARTRRGDAGGVAQSTTAASTLTLALTALEDTAAGGLSLSLVGANAIGIGLFAYPTPVASDQTVTGWSLAQSKRAVDSWKPRRGELVYRIWGGKSRLYGQSWTPVNPLALRMAGVNIRDFAGLPNGNYGNHLTMGRLVNPAAITNIRYATPLDGNRGGLIEYVIINAKANIKPIDTIPVKPAF